MRIPKLLAFRMSALLIRNYLSAYTLLRKDVTASDQSRNNENLRNVLKILGQLISIKGSKPPHIKKKTISVRFKGPKKKIRNMR